MKRLSLSEIARLTGGRLRGDDGGRESTIDVVCTDTRALPAEGAALFVALKGERFDGHDYTYDAAMRGASALLVEHAVAVQLPQGIVSDALLARAQQRIRIAQPGGEESLNVAAAAAICLHASAAGR